MRVGRRTVIKLLGAVPSKKNEWKRGKNGGIYFDRAEIPALIQSLTLQAQAAWRKVSSSPAIRPRLSFLFVIGPKAPDPDNMQTTLLDLLKKAGVIADDAAKALTPPLKTNWVVRAITQPETYVEIEEAA